MDWKNKRLWIEVLVIATFIIIIYGFQLSSNVCNSDSDCVYGWPDKCVMDCVNKNIPDRDCSINKVLSYRLSIVGNDLCKCVGGRCQEDKEKFCHRLCDYWINNNCTDMINIKADFFSKECDKIISCECVNVESS